MKIGKNNGLNKWY